MKENYKDYLKRIFDLVLEINEHGDYAFLELSPHVDAISLQIYKNEWKKNSDPLNYSLYYRGYLNPGEEEMNNLIKELEQFKKEVE